MNLRYGLNADSKRNGQEEFHGDGMGRVLERRDFMVKSSIIPPNSGELSEGWRHW